MKITYDKRANAVYIYFKENIAIDETTEDKSGRIIIDYAADGSIVGIEILNASDKLSFPINPNFVEL